MDHLGISVWQSEKSAWNARKAIYENQKQVKQFSEKAQVIADKIKSLIIEIEEASQASSTSLKSAIQKIEALESHLKRIPEPLLPQHATKTIILAGDEHTCTQSCRNFTNFIRSRMPTAFNAQRLNAILDLENFKDFKSYQTEVLNAGKGNARRLISKQPENFETRVFNPVQFLDDIEEILNSSPERQGGKLRPPYDKGAKYLVNLCSREKPQRACPSGQHGTFWLGIFIKTKAQIKNQKLVGFIMIENVGQLAHYRNILGHKEYLKNGIMYILNLAAVEHFYNEQRFTRFVSYAQWTSHPLLIDQRPGLTTWKKKNLFEPTLLYEIPSNNKNTIINWIKSQSRISKFPSDELRDRASYLFTHAAGFLGRRDLIHALDKNPKTVTVVDNDVNMMSTVSQIYPKQWSFIAQDFDQFLEDSVAKSDKWDLIVCDPWAYQESELVNKLSKLSVIAREKLIISLTENDFFHPNGIKPSTEALRSYLKTKSDKVSNVKICWSSKANGGCYWCTIYFSDKNNAR